MSVNKVILVGNVGRDPEIRYVETRPVASFSLATTERAYTTSSGAQIPERTEWHNIVMWDRAAEGKQRPGDLLCHAEGTHRAAETAEKYIRKGTKLYIEGKLRTRTWEDRNTIKRTVTEIYVEAFDILSRPQ